MVPLTCFPYFLPLTIWRTFKGQWKKSFSISFASQMIQALFKHLLLCCICPLQLTVSYEVPQLLAPVASVSSLTEKIEL